MRGLLVLASSGRANQPPSLAWHSRSSHELPGTQRGLNWVPKARVELARGCPQRFLRPSRLPFRHSGKVGARLSPGKYSQFGQGSPTGYMHLRAGRASYDN